MIKKFIEVHKSCVSPERIQRMKDKGLVYYTDEYFESIRNAPKEEIKEVLPVKINHLIDHITTDMNYIIENLGLIRNHKLEDKKLRAISSLISYNLDRYPEWIDDIISGERSINDSEERKNVMYYYDH